MKFYTYTGKEIEITAPDRNAISSEDIAHALSMICRASGHFRHFYSVAQHSINCMREAAARGYSKRVCMAALLHDASEAYLCDIPSPLKCELEDYKKIEKSFQDEVWKKYGLFPLSKEEEALVKSVDEAVLWYEFSLIHTVPIRFEKKPELRSNPNVECCDMRAIEQMMLREIEGFESIKQSA